LDRSHAIAALRALSIGAAGAVAASLLHLPAPLLMGPALATIAAVLAGMQLNLPSVARDAALVIIGLTIGLTATQEAVASVVRWPVSFALLTLSIVVTMLAGRTVLRLGWGYDRTTAATASMPGHLSYAVGLSMVTNCNVPAVSLIHSVRVTLLLFLVPLTVTFSGLPQAADEPTSVAAIAWPVLALGVASAVAAGLGLKRINVAAPLLIGSMLSGIAIRLSGLAVGEMPALLQWPAFVTLGTLIGTRFSGVRLAEAGRHVLAGVAFTTTALASGLGMAAIASILLGLPLATMLVAFVPGGLEVSAAMSVALGLDPTFVAAHHVFRLLVLPFLAAVLIPNTNRDSVG